MGSKRLHLKASGCDIPLGDPTPLRECTIEQQVRTARTVEVPPRSMLEIAGSVKVAVEGVWLMEGIANKRLPLAVARALVEPTSTTVPVCVLNATEEPVTVYAGMALATLQGVEVPTKGVEAVGGGGSVAGLEAEGSGAGLEAEKKEMLWQIAERTGPDLSTGEFYHLLLSYADVIASSTSDLGRTDKL